MSSQQGGCSVCDQRVPPHQHVMPAKVGDPRPQPWHLVCDQRVPPTTNTSCQPKRETPPVAALAPVEAGLRRTSGAWCCPTHPTPTGRVDGTSADPQTKAEAHKPNWSSWLEGHLRQSICPRAAGRTQPSTARCLGHRPPPPPARTWEWAGSRTVTQALRQAHPQVSDVILPDVFQTTD